jgi:hypothetical protein
VGGATEATDFDVKGLGHFPRGDTFIADTTA